MKETILRDGEIAIVAGDTQVIMNVNTAFAIFDKLIGRDRQNEAGSKAMAKEATVAAKETPKASPAPANTKNEIDEEYLRVCNEIEALNPKIVFAVDITNPYNAYDYSKRAQRYRETVDMRHRLYFAANDKDCSCGRVTATEVYSCGLEASFGEDVDKSTVYNITSTWHKTIMAACMNKGFEYPGAAWNKANHSIDIPETMRLNINVSNARWLTTQYNNDVAGGHFGEKHYRTFIKAEDLRYIAMTREDKKTVIAIWKEEGPRIRKIIRGNKA